MLNEDILKAEIEKYKEGLRRDGWKDNSKKLEAVEIFQNNWKNDPPDFAIMLNHSIMNNFMLLSGGGYNNGRTTVIKLAEEHPQEIHNMFMTLFDESLNVINRIENFKTEAQDWYDKDETKSGKSAKSDKSSNSKKAAQSEKVVTTYLWLKYPDKYFVYQYEVVQKLSKILQSDYVFKKGDYRRNLENFFAFYKEIYDFVLSDSELTELYREKIAGKKNCYDDPKFVTLTVDFAYGIAFPTGVEDNEDEDEEVSSEDLESSDDSSLLSGADEDYVIRNVRSYSEDKFLEEVFMSETDLHRLLRTLDYKKNIILQGPPGVGKTFAAKRLAYVKMGETDDDRIRIVQFHQNFSYEDFVMGYKPKKEGGFELKYGSFYTFCKKAENDPNNDYFFIIDEINRGNISKIFGELLMLIENEYRGEKGKELNVSLAYESVGNGSEAGEPFSVPDNLYIIGMMNTADRSLALIDYALRRRFSFFDMKPAFGSEEDKKDGKFWEYAGKVDSKLLVRLIETTQRLNRDIKESLGSGFMIGHSYFCGLNGLTEDVIAKRLADVVYCDILPTIREYWFDEDKKVEHWEGEFLRVLEEYE